jgi:tRNA modification GTPase
MRVGLETRETIYALSSGGGKTAVAIIRLSGPSVPDILKSMTHCVVKPRLAKLAAIYDPRSATIIDKGIVLWFPAPHSFTGEDALEFQVHGSRAVISAIFRILAARPDARLAEPGEFARRALDNGKLDLLGAEALADLIDAETEEQRKLATIEASGATRRFAENLRDEIIEIMALIETELDFAEDDHQGGNITGLAKVGLDNIAEQLGEAVANYRCVERIREGLTLLIAGPPNAGKSSLLNALAQRDVAIVSEHAGTTRDLIEVRLDLDGFPVTLIDTAGIRKSNDPIEQEGIRRVLNKSKCVDLVLWLTPIDQKATEPPQNFRERPLWRLFTKSDCVDRSALDSHDCESGLAVSALTGHNLDVLIHRFSAFAKDYMSLSGPVVLANERQRLAITSALEAVMNARKEDLPLEIVAHDLRNACVALERLIGKLGIEDVLDRLFARFCLGK